MNQNIEHDYSLLSSQLFFPRSCRNGGRIIAIDRILEGHSGTLRGHPVVDVVHAAVTVAVPSHVDDGKDEGR